VLAFSTESDRMMLPLIRQCEALGIELSIVPRLFESMNHRVAYEPVGALPVLGLRQTDPAGWEFAVKHAFDQVASFLLLVFFAPVLGAIALGVKVSSPGPILFRQTRVGRDGQIFDLIKFRTMREDDDPAVGFAPERGSAPGGVEGVDRRTPIGRFLRQTSLDELPQLVNVLRGQMSLVGPRPERPEFVELFSADLDRYADRHRVRSGITGWAQVHGIGRGETRFSADTLARRVEWDNYYIENWSLWLDVKVLLLTAMAVFRFMQRNDGAIPTGES
jgi:exopolysaccharide biosynthesis polyprenyl glycosylphosphotransferase